MNISLVDETGISSKDLLTMQEALQAYLPKVCPAWGITVPEVSLEKIEGNFIVYLTERMRQTGATGFHRFENGLPVAYCSPKAAGRLYGHYSRPLIVKGKTLIPERYTEGLITTIAHEIMEALIDPQIKNFSALDSQGRAWLVEVCDHCFGSYIPITVFNQLCVLPDITDPNFYSLTAKAPYTINNAVKAPFTLTAKGYGYYHDPKTGLLRKL